MGLNIAFAASPATLSSDGTLTVSGLTDPIFLSAGEGVEGVAGELVGRSIAVEQGDKVIGGPASLGSSKSWAASLTADGITTGPAHASGVEVYAFDGAHSPLTVTFTWSQDIHIDSA